jgi:hypothetical protein
MNCHLDSRVLLFAYKRAILLIMIPVCRNSVSRAAYSIPRYSIIAATPWIAFINCDRNSTNMTLDNDIFTMVQQKGAIAAVRPIIRTDLLCLMASFVASIFEHFRRVFG